MKNKIKDKNYKKSIAVIILLAILSVILLVYLTDKQDKEKNKEEKDFVSVNTKNSLLMEDDYILTNYQEYEVLFDDDELKEEDFEKNNYLIVKLNYNPCHQEEVLPTDYKINGNKVNITVKYKAKCGLCAPGVIYYLLRIDKDITKLKSSIKYEAINKITCPDVDY